jgi:hypothetical protein
MSLKKIQSYPWVGFLNIYTLLIIFQVKNLDIYKLFIKFWASNEYPLYTNIY